MINNQPLPDRKLKWLANTQIEMKEGRGRKGKGIYEKRTLWVLTGALGNHHLMDGFLFCTGWPTTFYFPAHFPLLFPHHKSKESRS